MDLPSPTPDDRSTSALVARARHVLTREESLRGAARSSRTTKLPLECRRAIARSAIAARWAKSGRVSDAAPLLISGPRASASASSASAPASLASLSESGASKLSSEIPGEEPRKPRKRKRGRPHPRNQRIRAQRRRYMCPPGCYPAYLASLYDELPWTHFVTLTAPPGKFREYLRSWTGLDAWSSLGDPGRPEWRPFWVMVLSNHDDPREFDLRRADVHAHLLVGGLPYDELDREVRAWPGISQIKRVTHRWGVLHYVFSQEKAVERPDGTWDVSGKLRHSRDVNSYCPALVVPPIESDNLYLFERAILRARHDERRRRAQVAARARRSASS